MAALLQQFMIPLLGNMFPLVGNVGLQAKICVLTIEKIDFHYWETSSYQ